MQTSQKTQRHAAIVTGVSRGLGEALASTLLDRGFVVLGVGRSASPVLRGERFRFARCELGEPEGIAAAVGPAFAALAGEGIASVTLINNAAVSGPLGSAGKLDIAHATQSLATNLAAPLALADLFCRTFTDATLPRRIINISSGAAARPLPQHYTYSIAKAGLEMLTQGVAADHGGPTFQCITLRPGVFETDMQRHMRSLDPAEFPGTMMFRGFKEQGLLKDPAEVAAAIVARLVQAPVDNGRVYLHTELY
jgi:benzil reductase ((S)-benzoin forming)